MYVRLLNQIQKCFHTFDNFHYFFHNSAYNLIIFFRKESSKVALSKMKSILVKCVFLCLMFQLTLSYNIDLKRDISEENEVFVEKGSDCFCICADGTKCFKTLPPKKDRKHPENHKVLNCRCNREGTCPKGLVFTGNTYSQVYVSR